MTPNDSQKKQEGKTSRRKILWQLFRPHTLTASFIPVMVGSVLAWKESRHIHWGLFAAMMLATILIQAATNMFNEYYDFVRGLDTAESIGIAGAITRDGVKARTVLNLALLSLLIAALLGIYICSTTSWWLAWIGLGCMVVGYLYTGGPIPIAYTPFGELLAGLFLGSGVIMIAYFVQTGDVSREVFLISIPNFVLIGAILMANNIRDREGDKLNGRHTLAILLGHRGAVLFMTGMFIFAYLWLVMLVLMGVLHPWTLLVVLSIPQAVKALAGFVNKKSPAEMMPGMVNVGKLNTLFGMLLILCLIVEGIFRL
ncbi:1,4-dihydroxy-2-naphthoate polyprenyltransferase [Dehalobacter sp. DCM]|uniref:1,4-dihydroxy-2-naphthoate polyprenyltransferase n=1 Tax=Dehalobacter sp. DCM TaxID=2907827 RepID=UPI0030819256|nr:1,4-dihydroxy-2-naphthoate polyprenyltransferase [Dehalobacter sp. DCM]